MSATIEDVEPLILKYQYEYFTWNRVAKIYLRYAEAINYAGYPEQALVVINGIFNNPNVDPIDAPIFFNEEEFLNFDEWYYLFDDNEPIIGNLGVRGRASLAPVGLDIDMSNITTAMDEVGALILNEAALELAFEGNRWEDLMRYARRNSDASILADAIADKFITAGDAGTGEAIRAKLLNPDNWYLPYTIPDNFVEE